MGSWFCRGAVFICLLLPENVIICDKCLSKCGKRAILNDLRFYYILRFITICVYRLNAKCNKKNNAKCSKLFNMVYVGGLV